jgi:hypothetical protein
LFGDNTTSAGLVYTGRSGRHFTYVFGQGPFFNLPFGGHALPDSDTADTPGTQLFYVPTDANDPLVTTDAATAAMWPDFLSHLDEFVSKTDCLNEFRGTNVTRNNCSTSWTNVFSLRLMQEISLGDRMKFDLMLDIENFGNLLNSDWGRVESYTAPSNVAPAHMTAISGGQFVLAPSPSYEGSAETITSRPTIALLPSVYRVQFGVRFRF